MPSTYICSNASHPGVSPSTSARSRAPGAESRALERTSGVPLFAPRLEDLSLEATRLAGLPQTGTLARLLLGRVPAVPRTTRADLDAVAARVAAGD